MENRITNSQKKHLLKLNVNVRVNSLKTILKYIEEISNKSKQELNFPTHLQALCFLNFMSEFQFYISF